jgi:hypothetical protein
MHLDDLLDEGETDSRSHGEEPMLRWLGWGIAACFRLRASLVVENICLRQQLLVLRCGAGSLGLEFATPTGASGCWRAAGSLTGEGPC